MHTYQVSLFKDGVANVLETFQGHSYQTKLDQWMQVYPDAYIDVQKISKAPIWTGRRYMEY